MVDRQFTDDTFASVYDLLATHRRDLDFYLEWLRAADSVLDVGCGTGALLHDARERGHRGRLCGLDPAEGMLRQARRRTDIEWVTGDAASATRWREEFDLAMMTGHAFQVLLSDDEVRAALTAIRGALVPGGRFLFETRDPSARAWERWTPQHPVQAVDPSGALVRLSHQVELPVEGEYVSFTSTAVRPSWPEPLTSRSTLRLTDNARLVGFLEEAGGEIEAQFGDWDGAPLGVGRPEIITVVRRRG